MTIETLRPSSEGSRTFFSKFLRGSRRLCRLSTTLLTASLASTSAFAGFSVSGTQLLDGNGQQFIMRGVNHAHTWYPDQTAAFADIANTGANTIRVVLSDGQQWTRNNTTDVANVISLCKQNELVCVLEVHDATGYGEASAAGTLNNVAQYWVDIADVLRGQEDYVIINIANEPYGNGVSADTWVTGHQSAIQTLRGAGLTHTLMVDAANWGQDWSNTMLQNASRVASADNLGNTMFSVHMYEVYQDRSTIENYVTTFLNSHNLPLVIGEFGADHGGNFVDADSILAVSEQYGVGYLGWSWSGNGSCCYSLDIVNNFNPSSLTSWGDRLINGTNGIRQTSRRATIYSGGIASSSSTSSSVASSAGNSISSSAPSGSIATSCNWYGSTFPVCTNQAAGWGWENNQSCIAKTTCSEQPAPYGLIEASSSSVGSGNSCGTAANGYPVCCGGSASDPDGDGWGWENNQSCVVQPITTSSASNSSLSSGVINIALAKPTAWSSVDGYAGDGSAVVDGNTSTRWASAWNDAEWLSVDLQTVHSLSRVVLHWEAAHGRAYRIQVSNDAENWTDIYSETAGNGGIDDLTVSGSGRYVRMLGASRATTWGYSLWEFEVYGVPAGGSVSSASSSSTSSSSTPSSSLPASSSSANSSGVSSSANSVSSSVPGSGALLEFGPAEATYTGGAINSGTFGELAGSPSAITWTFTAPVDGEYRIIFSYSTPYGPKTNHLSIAGISSAMQFDAVGIAEHEQTLSLPAGQHTVTLAAESNDWGYMAAHGLTVELLGGLTVISPANFAQLPSGADIEISFEKFGSGDLLYSINGSEVLRHTGSDPLVIPTSGDDVYRISLSLDGTGINESLRVTVGNPPASEFVETQGTQFVLNGRPWYFNGTNQYYLMFKPKPMTDDFFERAAHLGINAVRTWMFCHHTSTHDGVCVNRYDGSSSATAEQAREHFLALKSNPTAEEQAILDRSWDLLDYYVAKAEEKGIKLVLSLGDNWPGNSMGGIDVFARAVGGNGIPGAYSNVEARKLYKMWVDVVLNRMNSYTGVRYKDDPTIMIWELANEPRCTGGSGCAVGSTDYENFNAWIADISAHIKQEAPNQLVSIGAELDNNDTDAFVRGIHEHASVDVVSAHIYPKPWNLTTDQATFDLFNSRIELARQIGKPLYYGEFSYRMEQSTGQADALHRADLFDAWYQIAYANRDVLGGMMSWQLSGLEWGNGNTGSCQWCSGPYGEYSGGWYGNHDGYQFYCTLNESENSITGLGATGTNVEGSVINLDWHKPTCDVVRGYSDLIHSLNNE